MLGQDERPSNAFVTIANDLRGLNSSFNIALVCSGAIGFGVRFLGQKDRPSDPAKLQALSCIGQPILMAHWQKAFGEVVVGQALTTNHELKDKNEEKKLLTAAHALWEYGVIPIFNENDALADEEIKVGDNDSLAAHIALHLKADALVLLSDVEGIYQNFGSADQRLLRQVTTKQAHQHASAEKSSYGTGGLTTKITAAEIAQAENISTYLANAWQENPVSRTLSGEIGTKFVVHLMV